MLEKLNGVLKSISWTFLHFKVNSYALLSTTALILAICGQCTYIFANDNTKDLIKTSSNVVHYEDFGAIGDGKTDDQEAIVKAHAFANQSRRPVRANDQATYYIGGQDLSAIVETDTDFGTACIIIDDTKVQNINRDIFEIRSTHAPIKVKPPASLKRNQSKIPITLPGRCVVSITNSQVNHFIRKGVNQSSGTQQTDICLVNADGQVSSDTPIQWDFDHITDLIAYPVDETPLTLKGGRFTTLANNAESKYTYYQRGIAVSRSTVVVDGLEHRITGEGKHGAPYKGFLSINNCSDVRVRNVLFTAHKTYVTKNSANKPVSMGSYDFNAFSSLNVTLENCRQSNDITNRRYWGLMGSNFCKNLRLEGCHFSRFDAHKGVYNASIRNSTMGYMGINAIGKGTLLIENTTVLANNFIWLRADYGSTWEGDIIIRNCVFEPPKGSQVILLNGYNEGNHNFGYSCFMPEKITIDTLRINDANPPENYAGPILFADFNPRLKNSSFKQDYPYTITREVIRNVITTASGKPLIISRNPFMFNNVIIRELQRSP